MIAQREAVPSQSKALLGFEIRVPSEKQIVSRAQPFVHRTQSRRAEAVETLYSAVQVVFRNMGPRAAGREVDDALRRVQLPRIGVPLVDGCREPSIGPGQAFDSINCLGAGDCARELALIASGGRSSADFAGKVPCSQRLLELPMRTVPKEPLIPRGDKSKIGGVTLGEFKG